MYNTSPQPACSPRTANRQQSSAPATSNVRSLNTCRFPRTKQGAARPSRRPTITSEASDESRNLPSPHPSHLFTRYAGGSRQKIPMCWGRKFAGVSLGPFSGSFIAGFFEIFDRSRLRAPLNSRASELRLMRTSMLPEKEWSIRVYHRTDQDICIQMTAPK